MAVVVTGAAGFIGSHLVEALAARGERVIAIDRRPDMPAAAAVRIVADLVDAPTGAVDDVLGRPRRSSTSPPEPGSAPPTVIRYGTVRTAGPGRPAWTGCGTATTCSRPSGSCGASPTTSPWW
jgi:NAD dependent epimerase/dehydratase family